MQRVLYFFLALALITLTSLYFIRFFIDKQNVSYVLDKLVLTLENEIRQEKTNALKMAITISKDSSLVEALKDEDEAKGYKLISGITKQIAQTTGVDVKVQVLTHDYHIFARSWDDIYVGMPLEDYRSDLQYFATHSSPRSSIEIGRMLSIKTTVPVYEDGVLLGFVEIIGLFDSIGDFFRKIGVDLYVLMDDKYYNMAVFMQDNESIDSYIVANRNYNHNNLALLKKINFKELKTHKILKVDSNYIFCENIRDGNLDNIGLFVFVLNDRYISYFKDQNDETSFFINLTKKALYDVALYDSDKSYSKGDIDIKSLINAKDELSPHRYDKYKKEAYDKLQNYSKEELIELLLDQRVIKKVEGKIR